MIRKTESGPSSPPPGIDSTKDLENAKQADTTKEPAAPALENATSPVVHQDAQSQVAEHKATGRYIQAELSKEAGAPAGAPAETEKRLLYQPEHGDDVKDAQTQLNTWRSDQGKEALKEDGKFGPKTDAAVKDFQKANGLKADGIIGPNTNDRLQLETDPNFKTLNADTQKQVRDQMSSYPKDQASRTNLLKLGTDPNFAKLSREGQDAALKKLAGNSKDEANLQNIQENVKDRAALENNDNFKKLNADTQKKVLENMDKYSNDATARTQLSDLATDGNFGKLTPQHQEEALKVLDKSSNDPRNLESLKKTIGSESFQKMDDVNKTRTLNLAAENANNIRYKEDLQKLTSDPKFGALSGDDKTKALNVFEKTDPAGREALQKLLNKEINGTSALLVKGIGTKETTLDQLNKLSTSNIDARVADGAGAPANKAETLRDLMQEISEPSKYIKQSNRGTCTVTSMTYDLASKNPAEYARLVTDLSTTGQAKLADGNVIRPPADGFLNDGGGRSTGERLLQSSLMHYSNPNYSNWNPGPDGLRGTPDDGVADPTNPTGRKWDGIPPKWNSGMTEANQVKVLDGLWGTKHEYYKGSEKKDILEKTKSELAAGRSPVYTHVDWGPGASHIVEVTKIEGGRVYFRNPWGGNIPGVSNGVGPTDPFGPTPSRNPQRRVEDGPNGIESMSVEDYQKLINGIAIEKR